MRKGVGGGAHALRLAIQQSNHENDNKTVELAVDTLHTIADGLSNVRVILKIYWKQENSPSKLDK